MWVALLAAAIVVALLVRAWARSFSSEQPPMRPADSEEEGVPESVELPIEDFIDLHPFAPRDVPGVVESYLEAAFEKGFREVRLIHGRGKGVQRARVQSLLSQHPLVIDYYDAPVERGGWGATVAILGLRQ